MPQKICMSFNYKNSKKTQPLQYTQQSQQSQNIHSNQTLPIAPMNNIIQSTNRFNMNAIFASRGIRCG